MKKIIVSSFAVAMLLIACAPKTAPSATGSLSMPAISAVSTSQEDIAAGNTIFTTACTKCHGAKTGYVANHTYEQAIPVMTSMAKKAKLTTGQVAQLAAYVNSMAKK